jgi:hypothetical protein
MVAAGKISPEEGERLLNALNAGAGGRNRSGSKPFEIGDFRLPNVDVGRLAEMAVDLKKTVVKTAQSAEGKIKKSKAGKYLEPREYPISVDQVLSPDLPVQLDLNIQAGQLRLLGEMDEAGKLVVGRATCVPDAPVVVSEVSEFRQHVGLRHRLGTCWIRLAEAPVYHIRLENAAADTRLELGQLRAASLKLNNNAGNLDIRLGERSPHVELEITNNAGSVDLLVDSGYALKIHSSGTLSSSNIENLGLKLVDGSYVSPDWESNARCVEILLAQNVANCSISWRGAKKAAMLGAFINVEGPAIVDEEPAPGNQQAADGAATQGENLAGDASAIPAEEDREAALAEADSLAAEANAAVSQVQADIDRLTQSMSGYERPAYEDGAPDAEDEAGARADGGTQPPAKPAAPDLPSGDL